jgi:hypothetical protein
LLYSNLKDSDFQMFSHSLGERLCYVWNTCNWKNSNCSQITYFNINGGENYHKAIEMYMIYLGALSIGRPYIQTMMESETHNMHEVALWRKNGLTKYFIEDLGKVKLKKN